MDSEYRYQKTKTFFAQIAHPIEELGATELKELGAHGVVPKYRGIEFKADLAVLYRIVYGTRLCNRILAPLIRFDCHSDRYLYKTASAIDWSQFLDVSSTFAIAATVSQSRIQHSQYAALRLKDAIIDYFREKTGSRPSIDKRDPDVWFGLHIQNNKATISLDVAGGSLHRRGYRKKSVEASMQETVAAAIIRMSEWTGETPLLDPMCGSGTLLAEALMMVCRIPAGYLRESFGFRHLPDFDNRLWMSIRSETDRKIRPLPNSGLISGSDIDAEAVAIARENLSNLPHGASVVIEERDYKTQAPHEGSTIVVNPPYGRRIGARTNMEYFYREFGDYLKKECTGSVCYLYAGKRELLKTLGLRTSWKKPLVNGALDGRLARYDLY